MFSSTKLTRRRRLQASHLGEANMKGKTMTATTFTHLPGHKPSSASGGWLRRVFKKIAEGQERRARDEVAILLRGYGDDLLTDVGYSESEITKLRSGQKMLNSD